VKSNREAIFDSVGDLAIVVLAETFLKDSDEEHFSYPSQFLSFSSPAVREIGQPGRAAGGITILIRADLFVLKACSFEVINPGLLSLKLVTKLGFSFTLLTGYRTSNARSAFFVPSFFQDLQEKCLQLSEKQEKFLLVGDFNAKVGDASSVLGQLDEFTFLVPTQSCKPELDPAGRQLLEALSGSDVLLVPFSDGDGRYPVTCKANQNRASATGGSVIDLAYASLSLFDSIGPLKVEFEREVSSHAWLQIGLFDYGTVRTSGDTPHEPPPPPRKVMFFDLDKLSTFAHTQALVDLACRPDNFTVASALEAVHEFVEGYTVTTVQTGESNREAGLDPRLRKIRQRTRKLERAMKKARDPQRPELLEKAMKEELAVYFAEREAVALEKTTRLRERFHEARRAGHQHLAWRLARTHLSGKGGGVKTSSTTCIDRRAWEEHFARLFQQDVAQDLQSIDIGHTVNEILDPPIDPYEVQLALEKKRNLRAPGPDGFRVDFLRYVRFDETVCRALANLFTLILQTSEVPSEWNEAFLFVLYKGKGSKSDPNSYRGITLKLQFLKLLESVVCARLVDWIESNNLLPPEQLAYRTGLSGTDHLFLLNILVEDALSTGRTLCVGYIDLQKAFPSVNRRLLIEDLVQAGVTTRTVGLFRRLYTGDTFRLLLDGIPGHLVICVVKGVHEGSCLSPTLFIFFIRELPARLNQLTLVHSLSCPVIGGSTLSCMFFADDLTLLAYSVPDAQVLVDEAAAFFVRKGLSPNPSKCEFMVFGRQPLGNRASWNVMGRQREQQEMARYLGLHYQANGKWDVQLQLAVSKARSALGRCKIIMKTTGTGNVRLGLSFFDSLVSSVYRYGLGVWGVKVARIGTLDRLFAEYICWLFRFPRTTGTNVILANFARRCAKCDSLFLAAVQLAGTSKSRNAIWQAAVEDMIAGRLRSTWLTITLSEISKRGMTAEVLEQGAAFVAGRKLYGVQFAQFCFAHHLNIPTGSSSDLFSRPRPFGIYPFLLKISSHHSRYLFAFLCSVWRYIDRSACERYPRYCTYCDCENTGYHVLFDCSVFEDVRLAFSRQTAGRLVFAFSTLQVESLSDCREIANVGRIIFDRVRNMSNGVG
jgi:hypothetical protein